MEIVLTSVSELEGFASKMAPILAVGGVVLLEGEMGAGKTTFVRALAEVCAVKDHVSSPTFTLVHRYRGAYCDRSLEFVHVDLYRLERESEILGLDLDFSYTDGRVMLIEWAERLGKVAPDSYLRMVVADHGASSRQVVVTVVGETAFRLFDWGDG
jgi:tRNA threonylcarbamoyladenosine biosynthesis protein TsaE